MNALLIQYVLSLLALASKVSLSLSFHISKTEQYLPLTPGGKEKQRDQDLLILWKIQNGK